MLARIVHCGRRLLQIVSEGGEMSGMRMPVAATLALLIGLTAACGSNAGTSPPGSSPGVAVPAGVQFDPNPGAPSGQQTLVDPATLPAPGGASYPGCPALTPHINKGTAETMATQGSNRVVAVLRSLTDGSYNNLNGSSDTVFWHSANGGPWALVDVRAALGPVLNQLSVAAIPDGFAAFGSVIPGCGSFAVSTAVVLISPDGVTWTKTADLRRPFSIQPNRLWVVGKNLLLSGPEYVCADNPFASSALIVGQARFWRSSDGGHAWTDVPLASIGVLNEPAAPADQSGCQVVTGHEYAARDPQVSIAGSQAAIFGSDGTHVAISSDLATWTAASLSGLPTLVAASGQQQQQPVAAAIVQQNGQLYALELVDRYSTKRQRYISGEEPRAWVSADGGTTFTAEPQARPLDIDGDLLAAGAVDFTGLGGSYQMVGADVELDVTASYHVAVPALKVLVYRSSAGNLEQWQQCAAAPGADCRFASLGSSSFAGRDLKGIDLDSADLGTADLSGADLTGANLTNAFTDQAKLSHAVLARVNARGANFYLMDLSGDDLSGANFSGATLNASVGKGTLTGIVLTGATIDVFGAGAPSASFAGVDLSKVTFFAQGNVSLTNANFQGAKLIDATFSGVNLAGATFSGADLTGTKFNNATCPDGKPSDSAQLGRAACRL